MNIGIIGSGMIGGTAAKLFVAAGHRVMLSNSRGPATLSNLVGELGANAAAGSPEDAASFGLVTLAAIPFGRYETLPAATLAGKIVIDAGNYYPERDGQFPQLDSDSTTSTEMVAAHLAQSRVVKAFNTIYYRDLAEQSNLRLPFEERRAVFVAGDDVEAKRIVETLIEQIGFGAVDTGGLADGGRLQQPGTPVYNLEISVKDSKTLLSNKLA